MTRIRKRPVVVVAASTLVLGGLIATTATAAGDSSLAGSNFEIEADANLKVDSGAPSLDWANVDEVRKDDQPTGNADDSFGQGTKEDTAVPTVVDGSIPPNKSDLKVFGAFKEGDTLNGYLHLYWSRVQDPSGTTNMDFELNKSATLSSNGVTPVRSIGDLLITYDLTNGGTKATISKRTWNGTNWGAATTFADGDAVGTINTTPIAEADSAGLGSLSARTFGEASVKARALFGDTTECVNFGSAYLKSRSSDSFTSAVKDFIAPVPINLTNCGTVTVIKQTEPSGSSQAFSFAVSPAAGSQSTPFSLTDADATPTAGEAGVKVITEVAAGSYQISETVPTGWLNTAVQCTGSSSEPTYGTASATISVVASSSVVCTFTNTLKPKLTLVKQVINDNGGTAAATDWTLSADGPGSSDITGLTGDAAVTSAVVDAGTYDLSESAGPPDYSPSQWSCVKNSGQAVEGASIVLANGDVAVCTITNDDLANSPGPGQTVQSWVLKDTFSLSGLRPGAPDKDAATVTFRLYSGMNDEGTCTGLVDTVKDTTLVYSDGNTKVAAATDTGIEVADSGDYFWIAEYSGDAYNTGSQTTCGTEKTEILALDQKVVGGTDSNPIYRDDF